jgi:hypothetical protein
LNENRRALAFCKEFAQERLDLKIIHSTAKAEAKNIFYNVRRCLKLLNGNWDWLEHRHTGCFTRSRSQT